MQQEHRQPQCLCVLLRHRCISPSYICSTSMGVPLITVTQGPRLHFSYVSTITTAGRSRGLQLEIINLTLKKPHNLWLQLIGWNKPHQMLMSKGLRIVQSDQRPRRKRNKLFWTALVTVPLSYSSVSWEGC